MNTFYREYENDELNNIFGSIYKFNGSSNDLFHLAETVAKSGAVKPKLYQCCGTEDFLYEGNVKFKEFAQKLNLDLTYEEGPGAHDWGYWDMMIQKVLKWLPL